LAERDADPLSGLDQFSEVLGDEIVKDGVDGAIDDDRRDEAVRFRGLFPGSRLGGEFEEVRLS